MKMTMLIPGFAVVMMVMVASVCGDILKYESETGDIFRYLFGEKVAKYGKFKFIDCGNKSQELVRLNKLVVKPDPVQFPGSVTIGFSASIKETLTSPLEANVILAKKEGDQYIPLPCIGNIGSCHYDDICSLFTGQCPRPLSDAGIPCSCPFSKGSYTLDPTGFQVSAAVLPPGDYMAQGNVTYQGVQAACVQVYITFS